MSKDDWRIGASIWSGRLDKLSATWLSLPGLYLISYSNCCRNSDHLVCLADSLSWVSRYCNDLWSGMIVIVLPITYLRLPRIAWTIAKRSCSVTGDFRTARRV